MIKLHLTFKARIRQLLDRPQIHSPNHEPQPSRLSALAAPIRTPVSQSSPVRERIKGEGPNPARFFQTVAVLITSSPSISVTLTATDGLTKGRGVRSGLHIILLALGHI